ncbi:MAG: hypothetical protein IV085_14240 [Thiobacillus sp.]|nr:hypothetical protein [Thiobacillus sp.]
MKKQISTLLVLWGIAFIGVVPGTAYAEFNLDKLKAFADKAKAYQEKMKQESQVSSSTPSARAGEKVEENPSSGRLPEISAANPDVMGLTLGVAGLKEAREAFNKYSPKLNVLEDFVMGGEQPYTGVLRGYAENCGYMCYRHELHAKLASPEAGGRVVVAVRRMRFKSEDATSLPNMLDALNRKYGEGFSVKTTSRSGQQSVQSFWAWSSDGRLIALSAGHPCADARAVSPLAANVADLVRAEQYAQPALKAGCSAIVFSLLTARNDVLMGTSLTAVDVVGIVRSNRITAEARAAATTRQNQNQRGIAEQKPAPPL